MLCALYSVKSLSLVAPCNRIPNPESTKLKKKAGKILEMGLLKYTFDNKISVTNECNAVQRGEFLCIQNFAAHKKYEL